MYLENTILWMLEEIAYSFRIRQDNVLIFSHSILKFLKYTKTVIFNIFSINGIDHAGGRRFNRGISPSPGYKSHFTNDLTGPYFRDHHLFIIYAPDDLEFPMFYNKHIIIHFVLFDSAKIQQFYKRANY